MKYDIKVTNIFYAFQKEKNKKTFKKVLTKQKESGTIKNVLDFKKRTKYIEK